MKNWSKLVITMLLVFTMILSMAACSNSSDASEEVTLDTELPVNVMVLNGTTGFGMAKLISDAAEGNAALNYNFSVEADASNVTAALINGTADIAALPTNAASVVYNKTEGEVQLLALNTLGVLYLVTDDTVSVSSFEKNLFRSSACFLFGFFVGLILSFMSSLYILGINLLPVT